MQIVLAGASGLIGGALRRSLRTGGHDVVTLVRRTPQTADERQWTPSDGQLDRGILTGADAVICLSGAGVADHRWTDSYKQTLRSSRLDTVATLSRTMASSGFGGVFLSASAVGYYGDTGEAEIDESAAAGRGFLADLCVAWEQAAAPARAGGVRVAYLRSGVVLTRRGGLVKRLAPLVRMGIAGRLGDGRQFVPWITLADEVAAIEFLLAHDLDGPVNLTGPAPARNAEFVATLASLLHRPAVVPVPAFALKLVLGELAGDALGGQRARPTKLLAAGFTPRHADLRSALAWALQDVPQS